MANQLGTGTVAAIRQLAKRGWSNRRTARELDVNRETVAKYLVNPELPKEKPLRPGLKSLCSPLRDIVVECLKAGHSARTIHAELVTQHGFKGSYSSVGRFARTLRVNVDAPVSQKRQVAEVRQQQEWIVQLISGNWSAVEVAARFDETEDLRALIERVRNGRERDRKMAAAVLARKKGISNRTTAKALGLHRGTIRGYYTTYAESGLNELFSLVRRGTRKADQQMYKKAVISVLHAPPLSYGINRTSWKQADLQRVLQNERGLTVSRRCIREILKKAGYRWMW